MLVVRHRGIHLLEDVLGGLQLKRRVNDIELVRRLRIGLGTADAARPDPAVRRLAIAVTLVLVGLMARDLVEALSRPDVMATYGAKDYGYYMDITRRWLGGGPFYEPWQLTGPYQFTPGAPVPGHANSGAFYPPVALWLFAPFTVLPPVLWWAIPLGCVGMVL